MSEPSPSEPMVEDPPVNGHNEDDKSQLSEDLLNTLRKLQESTTPSATTPALPTPTQSTAQETQETVKMQESTPPPLSEWDQLRAQLREKPVDADRWLKLVALAEASRDLEKIKETYEGMLEVYPNVVSILFAPTLSWPSDRRCSLLCISRTSTISSTILRITPTLRRC